MRFEPTPVQEMAIKTDGNVLVAAAAGSGKTAVLVERVMRRLLDPVAPIDADRLLIVTFTNAAAAEMRSRIEKRLYEECRLHPDDPALARQKHRIASAKICTIDSFCIDLVRENFEKCGVEPDFRVGDGTALSDVSQNILSAVVEEQLELNDGVFRLLLDVADCDKDESNLTKIIKEIYLYSRQMPFPDEFLNDLVRPYEQHFDSDHIWYKTAFELVNEKLEIARDKAVHLKETAPNVPKCTEKCIAYAEAVYDLTDKLCNLSEKNDWDTMFLALCESGIPTLPGVGSASEYALSFKKYKSAVDTALKQARNIINMPSCDVSEQCLALLPAAERLKELVKEYGSRLFSAYLKENTLTFSDTEQLALSLLCEYRNGEIAVKDDAGELIDRFDEILVDEFQDVNDLQNTLFYVLSNRESRLFAVGDVKQSIYGFRGSNPKNFLNKKNRYVPIEKAEENDPKKIILSDNFRSRKGICDFVNYFFSMLMNGAVGELVYDAEEELHAAAEFPDCDTAETELIVIDREGESGEDGFVEDEARAIAEKIREIMSGEPCINGKNGCLRKAKYSDFTILLGTMQGKAARLYEVLTEEGIPVAYGPDAFLQTVEITTFVSLLKVIDNPRNDVELLTVMLSPIFSFTEEETAVIRAAHRKGDFFSAVSSAAENGSLHSLEMREKLAEMRRDAAILPVDRLVSKLLASTDYLNIVSALPRGDVRRNNLLLLVSYASEYCRNGRVGISGFLRFLECLPEKAAKSSSVSEDQVKLMSMHASKGLQFPICIIANLHSKINNSDSIRRILYSSKYGIGFKYYNEAADDDTENLGHRINSVVAAANTIEERLRLLYVAMTRAEERLIFVSYDKDIKKKLSSVADALYDSNGTVTRDWLIGTGSMNDWVLAAALLHPDAKKLREMSEIPACVKNTCSRLKIEVTSPAQNETDECVTENVIKEPDSETVERIKENLSYRYKYEALRDIQAKSSVSVIANQAESDRFAFSERPDFMMKDGLSAAEKGTAMHRFMQFVNMNGMPDIESELERLTEWQFMTEEEAASLNKEALRSFFESDVFRRILASENVHREMRFLTEIPAYKLDERIDAEIGDVPVIVQGAVDLCFEEDDGIVVLDFKTDRVDNADELRTAYFEQVNIYAKACEKIFGKSVKERLIYSFALSECLTL